MSFFTAEKVPEVQDSPRHDTRNVNTATISVTYISSRKGLQWPEAIDDSGRDAYDSLFILDDYWLKK